MAEIWLRTNTRLAIAVAVVALATLLASGLVALDWLPLTRGPIAQGFAWLVLALALGASGLALWEARRPRLAYAGGKLLVYMRRGSPIRVPIEQVECFLMGRAPSYLPRRRDAGTETTTVVVRLRPQAEEWSHVEVEPRLGSWCDSHIIIRGTWCQPIDLKLLHELNARLAAAQQTRISSKSAQ